MTTALEVPANWYPDPTGRAHARYWDGRMWTAHVVRDGVTTLDSLDGAQQPRGPGPFAPQAAPVSEAPQVGHGTKALQEMAAARPTLARRIRSMPITSDPRISTRGAIGVFLLALLLLIVGVLLFREGALTVDSAKSPIVQTVALDQPEYHVTFPNDWSQRRETIDGFDAVYAVPDPKTVRVGVVDYADAALSDPRARDAHLATATAMVAGWFGDHPNFVSWSTVRSGDKNLVLITYEVGNVFGVTTRVAEYVALEPGRAVILAASGPQAAVDRHKDAVAAATATARLKETVPAPASTPGSGGGTAATRSPT